MEYNKKSKFGVKNHEFVMRYIRQTSDQRDLGLPPYEYDEKTGLVHINGNFRCERKKLKDFRGIKFGVVKGNFYCHENKFKTMEGFPIEVHGDFNCGSNQLKNLIGAPQIVKGDFDAYRNGLESLEGCPSVIGGYFSCANNKLESLAFGPNKVGGYYSCDGNRLKNLVGAPNKINSDFECQSNELETLEGCPSFVKDTFNCDDNRLTSLAGGPKSVGSRYCFSYNSITSFEGLPSNKNLHVDANNNKLTLKSLKELPASVKYLNFDSNDVFLPDEISTQFIDTFLKNRSLEITVARFKEQIKEQSNDKEKEAFNELECAKDSLDRIIEELESRKKELVEAEENYKRIKETNIDEYINSLTSEDMQKAVGLLSRFGGFDEEEEAA